MIVRKWLHMILFLGIYLRCSYGVLRGQCGKCLKNNIACLDEINFAVCHNGEITDNLTPCPTNTICTSETEICKSLLDGFKPACYEDKCSNCKLTNFQAVCIDETTYGFCYGQTEPNPDSIKSCPDKHVCSIEPNTEICVPIEDGGIASCIPGDDDEITTTDSPTETIPTQGPVIDPDTFCGNMKNEGNYKPTDDITCRDYIFCYLLAGQYLGLRYTCFYYFNAEKGECQTEKPNNC